MRIYSWGQTSCLSSTQAVSNVSTQGCSPDAAETNDGTSQVTMSKPAELFQKLSALQKSDLTTFKKVTTKLAENFEQLASMATGPESFALSRMAQNFASAAQTGDVEAITPRGPGHTWMNSQVDAPAAPTPAPAPAPAPLDSVGMAFSFVDSLTTSGDGSSDPLQKLTALKASDAGAFKKVMGKVAQQLEQMANVADSADRDGLQSLAATFANSAETGDLSAVEALRPPVVAPPAPPPPPPAPPPAPTPVDVGATALSMVDALAPQGTDGASDPLQRLSALKTADPTAFKQVMGKVAQQLEQMADLADGSDRDNLQSAALTFANSAETGDLSALDPFKPPAVETPPAPPPPPPPPPPAPTPVDVGATARSLIDSLTPSGSGSSDPFQKLADLKASSSSAFKSVMGKVAQQLEQLADLADGSDRDNLQSAALTFANAAESGDLSALDAFKPPAVETPPAPPPPPPPPPPAPTPLDVGATALSLVDSLTPASGDGSGDPLQKLAALKTSNPTGFKQVMGKVAQQLEQMANLAQGSDRDNLQSAAITFANSAESGNLSPLDAFKPPAPEPPPPPPPAPAPAPAQGWMCGYAKGAYERNGPYALPQALDDAYTSALALVDSFTKPAAA